MTYQPRPIETSTIQLDPTLLELTERLAENTHEHWALQRLNEGWVRGDRRNDALKTHPGLVPYADLPDSEKQYDRMTALESLKAIVALGYQITKKPQSIQIA